MAATFTKLRLFFYKISFIMNKILPLLRGTLYFGRVKLC
jgi:hypothetical protein